MNKGFGLNGILIAILIILAVGTAGVYVIKNTDIANKKAGNDISIETTDELVKHNEYGDTLIELEKQRSRDVKRVSDMKQLQLALELYFEMNGYYPLVNKLSDLTLVNDGYINDIPINPIPGGADYTYHSVESGNDYALGFSLEADLLPNYDAGNNTFNRQSDEIPATKITGQSVVTGKFIGHYEKLRREVWGKGMCNTFVIYEGHPELIKYFTDMVNEGNTVNTISPDGYLRINLPWQEIPESVRTQIIDSTPEHLMELTLTKNAQYAGSAPFCYSFFSFN